MSVIKRVAGWLLMAVAGLAVIGLGVYFVRSGLDRSDKLASVFGFFLNIAGLAMTVVGVVVTWRSTQRYDGQSVLDSTVDGGVLQVSGVAGDLELGPARQRGGLPARRTRKRAQPEAASAPSGGQAVSGVTAHGLVRQIKDVGGNAKIDR